ncbi:aminoglycoside N3-acetyltransferase [Candidatus Rhodobacter oscarellae]|uniref:Aminoglycoside N(3)-acetyltransferase n=1 Tax=Candidatus Rhodobacter oscarellae TaxID=1675527 RepID=A0A0J9EB11_9RHOB|nr:AAC(3) family N-acetyltransferase [Candidatus Rhodobacter lobularis]KMW58864.1 aminoglycoside N3-acetyltransferase [Candidatus Rhodobacter lobularis]
MNIQKDLDALGVKDGDALFVHAGIKGLGAGPDDIIQALLAAVGDAGLVAMPGFSTDAYFPAHLSREAMTAAEIAKAEADVPGFDPKTSPTDGMGVLAERFRTWPGTLRSGHPTISVCAHGAGAEQVVAQHPLDWACGPDTPFGAFLRRPNAKVLLINVGWNRCSLLHTAETLADPRRVKTRRVKHEGKWVESPEVADDLGRLFPSVGAAFEDTGAVRTGPVGKAEARLCSAPDLVDFGSEWISAANEASGDRA